jgi:hypothetical protein
VWSHAASGGRDEKTRSPQTTAAGGRNDRAAGRASTIVRTTKYDGSPIARMAARVKSRFCADRRVIHRHVGSVVVAPQSRPDFGAGQRAPLAGFAPHGHPCKTPRMVVKHWRRSSVGEKRLTEDRRNLAQRYMIDAEEARAQAERAAQEEAARRAEEEARRAAEEARRAAAEQARRAAAEEAKQAAERQAKRAAEEAKQVTRAGAAATRVTQPVEPHVVTSEIAEPHAQPSSPEPTAHLPIYGWLDSRPKTDEALDAKFLSSRSPTARAG